MAATPGQSQWWFWAAALQGRFSAFSVCSTSGGERRHDLTQDVAADAGLAPVCLSIVGGPARLHFALGKTMTIASIPGLEPMFAERWFAGTYLVSGTFFLVGGGVTPEKIMMHIDPLYREVRRQKNARWPRGLAGFLIIPVFCDSDFSPEVCAWVRTRHPFKWAVWPEPLLYDSTKNTVISREDYRLFGRAFFPYLGQLLEVGLGRVSRHFGHTNLPQSKNAQPCTS